MSIFVFITIYCLCPVPIGLELYMSFPRADCWCLSVDSREAKLRRIYEWQLDFRAPVHILPMHRQRLSRPKQTLLVYKLNLAWFQNFRKSTSSVGSWSKLTRDSIAFKSWKRFTFCLLMAHFQIAPVAAASTGLLSRLLRRPISGSSPPYIRIKSRVSLSSAHFNKK